jgi:dihydrofolate reductase
MRSVTYSMAVSLDGYVVGPDGSFDWMAPDEEVFNLATDEVRKVGVHLLGRRLYETMLYWETADQNPALDCSTTRRSNSPRSGGRSRRLCSPPRCRRYRETPAWRSAF